jgi:hypothetical protein
VNVGRRHPGPNGVDQQFFCDSLPRGRHQRRQNLRPPSGAPAVSYRLCVIDRFCIDGADLSVCRRLCSFHPLYCRSRSPNGWVASSATRSDNSPTVIEPPNDTLHLRKAAGRTIDQGAPRRGALRAHPALKPRARMQQLLRSPRCFSHARSGWAAAAAHGCRPHIRDQQELGHRFAIGIERKQIAAKCTDSPSSALTTCSPIRLLLSRGFALRVSRR